MNSYLVVANIGGTTVTENVTSKSALSAMEEAPGLTALLETFDKVKRQPSFDISVRNLSTVGELLTMKYQSR